MLKQINVVGAILIQHHQILCAKRGPNKSLGGLWEFPGGKIEPNETPQQALKRELQEELRIDVTVEDTPFEKTSYVYDFGQVNLTTFLCHLNHGTPKLTEHEAILWLAPHELNQLKWAPADIPTVQKLTQLNW